MHTVKVLAGGVGLLSLCVLAGYGMDGRRGAARGAVYFTPLWLVETGINLYAGVTQAGYSVREELPVAAGVFTGPVVLAVALSRTLRRS